MCCHESVLLFTLYLAYCHWDNYSAIRLIWFATQYFFTLWDIYIWAFNYNYSSIYIVFYIVFHLLYSFEHICIPICKTLAYYLSVYCIQSLYGQSEEPECDVKCLFSGMNNKVYCMIFYTTSEYRSVMICPYLGWVLFPVLPMWRHSWFMWFTCYICHVFDYSSPCFSACF